LSHRSIEAIKKRVYLVFGTGNSRNGPWSLHQSPVTTEVKRDILTLHKDGLSAAAISRQLARSVVSVYLVLREAHLTPHKPTKNRTRFTDVELQTLKSWADRAVFQHEIAAAFPYRTSESVRGRLFQVRQELGMARRVKHKKWSPTEDARLLGFAARKAPHVSPEQLYIDIAPIMGASILSVRKILWHLKKKEQLESPATQNDTSDVEKKTPER